MNRYLVLLTSLLIIVLMLIGCTQPPSSTPAPAPAPSPATQSPIKIGLIYSLTGPVAPIGNFMVMASKFAFEQVGYEIAGRKIQTIIEDDAGRPELALDKARKLIEHDNVDLIMGPLVTSCVEATAGYISKAGIPQLVGSPNDLKLGEYDWHFMVGGSKQQMVYPMGLFAYEKLGFRTTTVLTEDSVTGRTFLSAFLDAFKSKGGKVVQEQYPAFASPDYASYLANLKDADCCAAWFQGADGIRFLIQYHEFGIRKRMPLQPAYFGAFTQPFLINNLPPPVQEAMLGEHMLAVYTYLLDFPESKKFAEAWKKQFNVYPDDVHATPYVLVQVALKALQATKGDTTPTKLREAILALDFESCKGRIRFDKSTKCSISDTYICKIGRVDNKLVAIPVESYKSIPPSGLK